MKPRSSEVALFMRHLIGPYPGADHRQCMRSHVFVFLSLRIFVPITATHGAAVTCCCFHEPGHRRSSASIHKTTYRGGHSVPGTATARSAEIRQRYRLHLEPRWRCLALAVAAWPKAERPAARKNKSHAPNPPTCCTWEKRLN